MQKTGMDAASLIAAGDEHKRARRNVAAIACWEKALAALPQGADRVEVLRRLSDAHFAIASMERSGAGKRMNSAITLWHQAVEELRKQKDVKELGLALHKLGALSCRRYTYSSDRNVGVLTRQADRAGIWHFNEALFYLDRIGDADGSIRWQTWAHLAHACVRVGDLESAEFVLELGLKTVPAGGEPEATLLWTQACLRDAQALELRKRAHAIDPQAFPLDE